MIPNEKNLLYYGLTGSRAYGIHTESSDYDYRGIFVNTPEEIFGLCTRNSQEYPGDIMLHSLKKFITLAASANPNILEYLFLPKECILFEHRAFNNIMVNRNLFLTKKVKYSYSGYAMGQLKRNLHKSTHGTLREKYLAGDQSDPYDAKFAGHTIRLMLNAVEIFEKNILNVRLTGENLELVKAIRQGKYFSCATEFYKFAYDLDKTLTDLYASSKLPASSDINELNNLLISTHKEFWKAQK